MVLVDNNWTLKSTKVCSTEHKAEHPAPGRSSDIARQNYLAAMQIYRVQMSAYLACLASAPTDPLAPQINCGSAPTAPAAPQLGGVFLPVPTLDPQTAAYAAIASLRLTPPRPAFGPGVDLNPWKMAAVGYPYWLWVTGNLRPPPAADDVAGLHVSLTAHIAKVVWTMGDGHDLSCAGPGTPWTNAVEPGEPSPTCGYTYRRPSLPRGSYRITARTYWSIDWNANGTTGTITYVQAAGTTIPVGEIQVLNR